MFDEEFEKLSGGEQAQFRHVAGDLLYHCYLVRKDYDKASKMSVISPNYLFVERHYDLLSAYFAFAGISLSKDDELGVAYLSNDEDANRQKVDTTTTLVAFVLRYYYEEKMKENPALSEVILDSGTLKGLLKDLGLSDNNHRLTSAALSGALRTMLLYRSITMYKGSLADSSFSFLILPSIRYLISSAKIQSLYAAIRNQSEGQGEPLQMELFQSEGEQLKDNLVAPEEKKEN